jgi:hypothetical protein
MTVKETVSAGVVSTSVMTAFSYAVSAAAKENFKEPALLSVFVKRLTGVSHPLIKASGWPVHYTLGSVWASVYTLWVKGLQDQSSVKKAVAFGIFSGTVGVVVWRLMFQLIPHPPETNRRKFYQQLFVAHLLFALSLAKAKSALQKRGALE